MIVAVVAMTALALVSTTGLVIAGLALRHAVVRDRDLTQVRRERRAAYQRACVNPLGIFTAAEVDALSFAPRGSVVRGTQFVPGRRCPDPWAEDLVVEDHLLAVYANLLREMLQLGTLLVEVVVVLGAGMVGVGLTELVTAAQTDSRSQLPMVLLFGSLIAVILAVSVKLLVLQEWQSAANRYHELAIASIHRARMRNGVQEGTLDGDGASLASAVQGVDASISARTSEGNSCGA